MEIVTNNATETQELGRKVASSLTRNLKLKTEDSKATIIALNGDLGAGKTTFVQGFAEGLGIATPIISPTFILMRSYEIPLKSGHQDNETSRQLLHVDLYRLEKNVESEVENLGLFDEVRDPSNIIIVEWADKLVKPLSEEMIEINIEHKGENTRTFKIQGIDIEI